MMTSTINKIAPKKYKGSIKRIPLHKIIDYISFTCILYIKNGENTGALYFKNGNLIGARFNNEFNISKADEIIKWETGTYSYQKWTNNFEIDIKQAQDILYFIEITNIDAELCLFFDDKFVKIFCSEGVIVGIEPYTKDITVFFNDILKETKGNIKIKCNKGQTGDLKEYFSEIINHKKNSDQDTKNITDTKNKSDQDTKNKTDTKNKSDQDTKNKTDTKNKSDQDTKNKKTSKKNTYKDTGKKSDDITGGLINTDIIEQSFNNLRDNLKDTFIAGCIYTSSMGKPLYSFNTKTNQSVLFAKLHKTINDLLINSGFRKINKYYLLDTEENYLIFILTFKEHHFGLVFDKSKIKLGYLFNIIKPILVNDYENALKS